MSRIVTREEVKKHNTKRTIWVIIHNEVYDVTKFLDEHPGGADSLMDFAGKDGSQAFEDVGHSDDARVMMKKYKIAALAPGEHSRTAVSCARASKASKNDCLVCQAASCPRLPNEESKEKTWRTFDGSRDRSKGPKSDFKSPSTPRAERRIQTIVVPRERRRRRTPPSSGRLKWILFALGAAILVGLAVKKYAG